MVSLKIPKKEAILFFFLVFSFLFSLYSVSAACCVTQDACTDAVSSTTCSALGGTYDSTVADCTELNSCDIGYCCGDSVSDNSVYRHVCIAQSGTFTQQSTYDPFTIDSSQFQTDASNFCNQLSQCTVLDCSSATTTSCLLNGVDIAVGRYICQDTSYASQVACQADSRCAVLSQTITGYVHDENRNPLSGAALSISGTSYGVTNIQGFYTIQVQLSTSAILTATYLGKSSSTTITSSTLNQNFTISLQSDSCTATELYCGGNGDSDCDGLLGCNDPDCSTNAACGSQGIETYCGDNVVQQPNFYGVTEECDATYDLLYRLTAGNDTYCKSIDPSLRCVSSSCMCQRIFVCEENGELQPSNLEECDAQSAQYGTSYCQALYGDNFACNSCKCEFTGECGDGTVESPEQCDPGRDGDWSNCWEPVSYQNDPLTSSALECTVKAQPICGNGQLEVTEECDVGTNSCGLLGSSCILSGSDACTCSTPCSSAIDGFSVDDVFNNKTLRLSWANFETSCSPVFYNIYRGSSGDLHLIDQVSEAGIVFDSSTNQLVYYDDAVVADTTYCYSVETIYTGGVRYMSEEFCEDVGTSVCFDRTYFENFCNDNSIVNCVNPDNTLDLNSQQSCGSSMCLEYQEGAQCVVKTACDECNGPLEMYYYKNYEQLGTFLGYGAVPITDYTVCSQLLACYEEKTDFVTNDYASCENVHSCYDYLSQDSCELDKCAIHDCNWESDSVFSELGQGVCQSTVNSDQLCELCTTPSFDAAGNEIYGSCTEYTCENLYGSCYFKDNRVANDVCISSYNLRCSDYLNADDCTGGFNATYAIGTTNEQISQSQDFLELGVCRWSTYNTCIKDADNNFISDCSYDDLECNQDFELPRTHVIVEDLYGGNDYVEFGAIDNVGVLETYYCLVPQGTSACYPTTGADGSRFLLSATDSATYTLYYFSRDVSQNLELVKSADIAIDAVAPTIRILNTSTAYLLGSDLWRSNLNITIFADEVTPKTNESYQASYCESTFISQSGHGSYSGIQSWGEQWTLEYTNLEDGMYILRVTCEDRVGNVNTEQVIFQIEADKSITNLRPSGTVYSLNINPRIVELSATTAQPATCRYGESPVIVGDFSTYGYPFDVTGGVQHTKSLTYTQGSSESIEYYVKCEFQDVIEGPSIKGNSGDFIYYSLDDNAPQTQVAFLSNDKIGPYYNSQVNVRFNCIDEQISGIPGESGNPPQGQCDFYYCKALGYGSVCTPQHTTMLIDSQYNLSYYIETGVRETSTFYYYAEDPLGNTEELKNVTLFVDVSEPVIGLDVDGEPYEGSETFRYDSYSVTIHSDDQLRFVSAELVVLGYPAIPLVFTFSDDRTSIDGQLELYNGIFGLSGYDGSARIRVTATNLYDLTTVQEFSVFVDTHAPQFSTTLFDPSLNDYDELGYPLYNYNNVYYTNQDSIYLSGYVDELSIISYLQGNSLTSVFDFNQFSELASEDPSIELETFVASESESVNLYFEGDFSSVLSSLHYVKLTNHDRREYEHYDQYYFISSVSFESSYARTRVTLLNPLEYAVPVGTVAQFYSSSYPVSNKGNYFGGFFDLVEGNTTLRLAAEDENGNIRRSASTLLYRDTHAPRLQGDVFRGSTDNTSMDIIVTIYEQGSGLDLNDVKFYVNSIDITTRSGFRVSSEGSSASGIIYTFVYDNPTPLDGQFDVYFEVHDKAHNNYNLSWRFEVLKGAPQRPDFWIDEEDTSEYNPLNGRWFTRASQVNFNLNFTGYNTILNITQLYGSSDNLLADPASCTGDTKLFGCSFSNQLSEGDYEVFLGAYRVLTGFKISPQGHWTVPVTVDRTNPDFTIDHNPSVGVNGTLMFTVDVTNENYDLIALVTFSGNSIPLELVDSIENDPIGQKQAVYALEVSEYPVGTYPFQFTLMDYAGNENTISSTFIIDNTEPDFTVDTVYSNPIAVRSATSYVIKEGEVVVQGTIIDSDITTFCIRLQNAAPQCVDLSYPQSCTTQLLTQDSIYCDGRYKLTLNILNAQGNVIDNVVDVYAIDYAENEGHKTINVLADKKSPNDPRIIIR